MFDADPVLGKYVANYPSDRARLVIPAGVVIGAVALALNFTLATVPDWWGPPLSTLIMALTALGTGWRALHFWNREVVVYERGFSYREGSRIVPFLYGEIASIRQRGERLAYFGGLVRLNRYQFTLTTARGESMTLTNLYRNIEKLGAQLEQKVYALLGPALQERLKQGEMIAFAADLKLNAAGLHHKGRELAWTDFAGYKVGGGQLNLLAAPDESVWLSLPLSEIDNIPLLLEFLKRQRPTNT